MIEVKEKKYNSDEYQFTKYEHFWIVNLKYAQVLQNEPEHFYPAYLNDEHNIVYYNGIKLMYIGCYHFEVNNIPPANSVEQTTVPIGIFVLCDNIERIHHRHYEQSLNGNICEIMVPNTKIILIDDINTLAILQNNENYTSDIESSLINLSKNAWSYIDDNGYPVATGHLDKIPLVTYLGTLPAKLTDPDTDPALRVGIYFINNKTNEN